ncbi:MAG: sialidase family protein, partial [Anaerolineae bacterium]|nr:glycoside hydrolase [Thermoflexales bacterium]MDW8408720.1 sialidase family protein [Anaerolineae bacterium]
IEQMVRAARPAWTAPAFLSQDASAIGSDRVPAVVADKSGDVYAMWTRAEAEGDADTCLHVIKWSAGLASGPTLAVCSPPLQRAKVDEVQVNLRSERPALALDDQGRLHAVWTTAPRGELLYSWALGREATSASAWAAPTTLPTPVVTDAMNAARRVRNASLLVSWPQIVAHPLSNDLFVIYTVTFNEGRGVYMSHSPDGGTTWLPPVVVFDASAAGWDGVEQARLSFDPYSGVLHAAWLRVSLPGASEAQGVYYARSADMGRTWSSPLELSDDAAGWLQITTYDAGKVYVVWTVADPQLSSAVLPVERVWGRYSVGGAAQWSAAAQIAGLEVDGPVALTSDLAGHVFVIGAGRRSNGEAMISMAQWNGAEQNGRPEYTRDDFALGDLSAYRSAVAAVVAPTIGELTALINRWSSRTAFTVSAQEGAYHVVALKRKVNVGQPAPLPTLTPVATVQPTEEPVVLSSPAPAPTPTTPVGHVTELDGDPADVHLQGNDIFLLSGVAAFLAVIVGLIVWRAVAQRR